MNSKDLIMWIVKILLNSNKNCDVFNVGSDEAISIKKLAQLISRKYKKKIIILYQKIITKNLISMFHRFQKQKKF